MKGALLDWIKAKTGEFIQYASVIVYTNSPSFTDMPDDGLITKSMLLGYVIPPVEPIVTAVVGGTTGNPITIDHTGINYPTIILRNADGSVYAGSANNVDDGTHIVLTGDDDGTGKFVDSFTIILKP